MTRSLSKHRDMGGILTETDGPLWLSDTQAVTVVDFRIFNKQRDILLDFLSSDWFGFCLSQQPVKLCELTPYPVTHIWLQQIFQEVVSEGVSDFCWQCWPCRANVDGR